MQKFFILYRKVLKQRQLPKTRSFLLRTIYMKKLLNFWLGRPSPGISPLAPQGQASGDQRRPKADQCQEKINQLQVY